MLKNGVVRKCEICGTEFRRTHHDVKKGWARFCSLKCKGRWMSQSQRGENNPSWRDDEIGYSAIHAWLRRNYTLPERCEICGKESKIELALKNGCQYKRKIENFIALCPTCHKQMDYANGTMNRNKRITKDNDTYPQSRKDAQKIGGPRYYTGNPCKRGHDSPRYTASKTCVECDLERTDRKEHYKRKWPSIDGDAA